MLHVVQYYDVITMAGTDFSKAAGDFVFQFECAWSPDKPNIVMQDLSSPATIRLPFEIERSTYISYAVGFNYHVPLSDFFENHSGEAVFTLDWFESRYFDDHLAEPSLSDILTLRFQDSHCPAGRPGPDPELWDSAIESLLPQNDPEYQCYTLH